jgi:hypothetical protein
MVAMSSATRSGLCVVETKPQVMTRSLLECLPSHIAISRGSFEISKPSICR